ncbi:MAG: HDOD domain-containing protein [Gammaproteobacteria bacterium]|nr:HDOD domain-containing protein [Gammaproteobacteria bacterium]
MTAATITGFGQSTLDQMSTLQLPTLPAGAPYLLKSLTSETIDFVELAAVVEKFPGIAGKLISLVNSAWSAPVSEVTSLEVTCSRLGLGVVRSTSIALAIAAPFNPARCPSFDLEYYWCSVLLTADAASRLVPVSSPKHEFEPATARAAGLLHNLGLLWLVDRLPVEVDQALIMVKNDEVESLQQALSQVLGFDQAQAGGHLGNSWALPEPLVSAMRHYAQADYPGAQCELVITVGLATRLVAAILKQEPCPGQDIRLSRLGITEENLNKVFEQLKGQLVKTRDIAKVLI